MNIAYLCNFSAMIIFFCTTASVCTAQQSTLNNSTITPADDSAVYTTNSLGMKLKLIRAGSFTMGANDSHANQRPAHPVKLTKPFYIGVTEVTQKQYETMMGVDPSEQKGDELPVSNVSWFDAQSFCKKLSEKEKRTYRLPVEAEREYACRAGVRSDCYWGNEPTAAYAWYAESSGRKTHPVAQLKPNPWGLYDMVGNVWEWCEDWYEDRYSARGEQVDPKGPTAGTQKVIRGGSYLVGPCISTSVSREDWLPTKSGGNIGFRVVMAAE